MRMRLAAALFAATACATAASAGPMDSFYGNTVVVTYPNKAQAKFFVNADATYTAAAPDGSVIKGSWAVKGDQLCITQTAPAAAPESCSPVEARKVGDVWTLPGPDGSALAVTLVAGR